MKEEIYMNEIIVKVEETADKAYLIFNFDEPLKLELTSDDREKMKVLFSTILNNIISNQEVTFKFDSQNKNDLYTEISDKYIKDLNSELEALRDEFNAPNEE